MPPLRSRGELGNALIANIVVPRALRNLSPRRRSSDARRDFGEHPQVSYGAGVRMFANRISARHARTNTSANEPAEREADRLTAAALDCGPDARRATPASDRSGASGTSALREFLGPGQPLDPPARRFFEPRFGVDLSAVRVHTDRAAQRSADALDALACSDGRDVIFGPGRYSFQSDDGRRLLGHELAHVVARRQGIEPAGGLFLKAKAIRFRDEPTLENISDGKAVLKEGDSGEAVIRVTTALAELGLYTNPVIDEKFDPPLTSAVTAFQNGKLLAPKTPGVVDRPTFEALDAAFNASYAVERGVIAGQTAADPLHGTQSLDAAEKTASARAISTKAPVSALTGALPTFRQTIPGKGTYRDRLTVVVEREIVSQFNSMGKGATAAHADPAKLYDWSQVEIIARESQKAVDRVFGAYYSAAAHPALKKGVNIFDAFADKVSALSAGGKAVEDARVAWRVAKILTGEDAVAAIDLEHGAIQSRPPEAAIVASVTAAMIAKYRVELIETDKAWPGFAGGGRIFIQLFKGGTADRRRADMWEFFQTFVHEYIHTLESSAHVTYRKTMDEQTGNKALREGVTDYFTKIVWNGIALDDSLRSTIEGPFHDPAIKFAVGKLNTYRESENAERLAGVVGVRNVMAAFFLGRVDLIGKP